MIEWLIQFLIRRSQRQYPPWQLLLSVLTGATMELAVVPAVLVIAGKKLDTVFGIGRLLPQDAASPVACGLFLVGIPWLAWSVFWQHRFGKGTPLPLVPTKTLLCTGPYAYTRNPMAVGTIFWLAGWAVMANSPMALWGGVSCFTALVLAFDKLVEEKELERRFGDAYGDYKKQIPFLIPRLIRRRAS